MRATGRSSSDGGNQNCFLNMDNARRKIDAGRAEYNEERSDCSLAYRTPAEITKGSGGKGGGG